MMASYGLFSIQIQITWSTLAGGVVTVPQGRPTPLEPPLPPGGGVGAGVGGGGRGGGGSVGGGDAGGGAGREVSMTSRGRPKLDSREWIESGEGDVPLTAKLTSPPRDISEVTST